jgi:Glycoside-hydrolase family GH114
MRNILKALACVVLPFLCIGWGFAQARSGEPMPSVLTPEVAAHLPAPVPCDAKKGSCWKPTIGMEWQWQLSCDTAQTCTNLEVHVPFYVIDAVGNPASTVAAIHKRGEHAYCYVDIGSWEETRSDVSRFPESVLGKRYEGWPKERWLDIRQLGILAPIMIARMKVCVDKGFDGVEFDNVEDYDNPTGFPITEGESAYYTAWMANQAHKMGLSTSWENAPTIITALEPYMEALLFESCYNHGFCQKSAPMIDAGKWVGGVEYKADLKDMRFCPTYAKDKMVGAFRERALKSYRVPCDTSK